MVIDPELAAFLAGPVMTIVGSRDGRNRAEIGRGVGTRVITAGVVEVVVSGWQWPATLANLRANGAAAITFANPADYVCYQIKGQAALRPAEAADLALSAGYIAAMTAALAALGVEQALSAQWLTNRGPVVVRTAVESVFIQTPGPRAGTAMPAEPPA